MNQGRENQKSNTLNQISHDDLHEASHLMYSSGAGAIFLERVYEAALRILTDFDD